MALSTIERVLFLRGVDLFGEVRAEELVPIARVAREVTFEVGEVLIRQGDIGDCLYLIVDGDVSIVIEGVGEVARRGGRSIIGEMAIISQRPRSAHCIAVTDVAALRIGHDDFWELLDEQPGVARSVITVLAQRLDEAVANLQRLGGGTRSG